MKAQEIIINQILEGLEQWEIPREKTRVSRWPSNMVSKKNYRWFNSMLLQWKSSKNNWSRYWLTYKQAKEMGGQVKKWEKGTSVIFYTMFEKEEVNSKGEHDKIPMLRYYTVFNYDQTEWIPKPIEDTYENEKLPTAEKVIDDYLTRENIEIIDWEPAYSIMMDKIKMPWLVYFKNNSEYYQAFFHEMTHSTGHEKRLNRKIQNSFGTEDYSKEELVAEVGASILANETGTPRNKQNTQAYINGRLTYIKDKPNEVIQAFTKAMKGAEYILDINQDK